MTHTDELLAKVAIVTGANQGLGLAIARRYAAAGASLVLCARDATLLAQAREAVQAQGHHDARVLTLAGDVSDPAFGARLAEAALTINGRIDVLVNNAGVYGPMGPSEEVDWAAWMRTLEINLLGSVLTCRAVLPAMKQQRAGKIVQLSGGGATSPMPNISAYAVSKAAVVRFADTLAEEVREFGIDVNAIAPGALNTRMLDEVIAAGPQAAGADFFARSKRQKDTGGAGLEKASDLAVFLASAASNGITGKLISALWDDWPVWPAHRDELARTDAYTLRRIAGRDRGLTWGDK